MLAQILVRQRRRTPLLNIKTLPCKNTFSVFVRSLKPNLTLPETNKNINGSFAKETKTCRGGPDSSASSEPKLAEEAFRECRRALFELNQREKKALMAVREQSYAVKAIRDQLRMVEEKLKTEEELLFQMKADLKVLREKRAIEIKKKGNIEEVMDQGIVDMETVEEIAAFPNIMDFKVMVYVPTSVAESEREKITTMGKKRGFAVFDEEVDGGSSDMFIT